MPTIGETRKAQEVGRQSHSHTYTWVQCPTCQKCRWVLLRNGKPANTFCQSCSRLGERHSDWRGGRQQHGDGHIRVRLYPGDFFFSMADTKGRVMEHRLVMAKHLRRCLHPFEVVHHKNGIPDDNRIENLVLTMNGPHVSEHRLLDIQNGVDPFHGKGYRRN